MRFIRHSTKSDWGLGVVTAEDATNLDILFEGIGYRKLAKSFQGLVDVAEDDVPTDHGLRSQKAWPQIDRDGQRTQARRDLPKRFDGFLQEFLAQYPEGLLAKSCDEKERDAKVEACAFAQAELTVAALDELFASGGHAEIIQRTLRVLTKASMAFPNELTKFRDVPEASQKGVAERIVKLVKAGERTPEALEALATALGPHGAAKWPVVSLIPFLLDPVRWPFVKPTFVERAAKATGLDVEYDARPNARTYSLVCDLYRDVAGALKARDVPPRDLIDVQTFLWIATGMAREAQETQKARRDAKASAAKPA